MGQMQQEKWTRTGGQASQEGQGGQHQQQSSSASSAMTRGGATGAKGMTTQRRQREPYLPSPLVDPLSFVRRFMGDIDRMFDDFGMGRSLSPLLVEAPIQALSQWAPQIEVYERDGQLVVRADLPGVDKEDVRVRLDDDALIIEGERRDEREEARGGAYVTERTYGLFRRVIPLPQGVDPESIEARIDNGVLEVCMKTPQQQSRGRNIEVRSGGASGGASASGEAGSSASSGTGTSGHDGGSAGSAGGATSGSGSREPS